MTQTNEIVALVRGLDVHPDLKDRFNEANITLMALGLLGIGDPFESQKVQVASSGNQMRGIQKDVFSGMVRNGQMLISPVPPDLSYVRGILTSIVSGPHKFGLLLIGNPQYQVLTDLGNNSFYKVIPTFDQNTIYAVKQLFQSVNSGVDRMRRSEESKARRSR